MPTLEVGSASGVAEAVANHLPQSTPPTARELYRWLVATGAETTRRRGHSPSTCEVVMHLPLEQLAAAAGVSRITVWRHLRTLRDLGVLDWRSHKASCRGETRNSGTVWRVRLTPKRGCRARVSADDLRHKWRDLDGDVRRGRTSWASVKHTKTLESQSLKIECLLSWTLPPKTQLEPVTLYVSSMARRELESVLDVTGVVREERSAAVDEAAHALAAALRDQTSTDFYRRLLWNLLRRYDATGEDHSYAVYLAAVRARADAQEHFARRPGALFTSRLKAAPWWSDVMNGPPTRVGTRPETVRR